MQSKGSAAPVRAAENEVTNSTYTNSAKGNKLFVCVRDTTLPTEDPTIVQDWYDKCYLTAIHQAFPLVDASGYDSRDSRFVFIKEDMPMVRASVQWLRLNAEPSQKTNTSVSSYRLKHLVERSTSGKLCGEYVSNGSFIAAALMLGYNAKQIGSGINCYFNMKFTPAMKKQIKGY